MLRTAPFKLAQGSHPRYDPDKGVCLVEAAIMAAGFKHRQVQSFVDCPPCFSRVLAEYAIRLNDAMPKNLRNELLLPFVTRLSGTAASEDIEDARARFIAEQADKYLRGPGGLIQTPHHKAVAKAMGNRLNPRRIWTIAALILDRAIRIDELSPAQDMSALIASATNMKPLALAAGLPAKFLNLTGNSNSLDIPVRRPSRPRGSAAVQAYLNPVLAAARLARAAMMWSIPARSIVHQGYGSSRSRSDSVQIVRRGLACLSIGNNVESDLLSLVENTHGGTFDRADVHEDILAAIIWLDKAEAFLVIEELHGSFCHMISSFQVRV